MIDYDRKESHNGQNQNKGLVDQRRCERAPQAVPQSPDGGSGRGAWASHGGRQEEGVQDGTEKIQKLHEGFGQDVIGMVVPPHQAARWGVALMRGHRSFG